MILDDHHSYLAVGDSKEAIKTILVAAKELTGQNQLVPPDWSVWESSSWGVDQSRAVKDWQLLRPTSGDYKFGIIVCETMTAAAGQALLKVFEEPAVGVRFFIVMPRADGLIATLRSRLSPFIVNINRRPPSPAARAFLTAPMPERFKQLESILTDTDPVIVRQRGREFVAELATTAANLPLEIKIKTFAALAKSLKQATGRLDNPRLPVRFVLETLTLSLPPLVV